MFQLVASEKEIVMSANAQNVLTNDDAISKISNIFENFLEGVSQVLKQNLETNGYFRQTSEKNVSKNETVPSDTAVSASAETAALNSKDSEFVAKTNDKEMQKQPSISELARQVEKNRAAEQRKPKSRIAQVADQLAVNPPKPVNE